MSVMEESVVVANSAEIYEQAINKLRTQVWVWIIVIIGLGIISVRIVRYMNGVTSSPPLALAMQIALGTALIGGFLMRNSPQVKYFQTGYLFALAAFAPFSFLFFGGVRGLGEINLILAVMGSMLFGFRRWMAPLIATSVLALFYVIYLEFVGRPVEPFVNEQSAAFSTKFILVLILLLFCLYTSAQFYQRLFESYNRFNEEQVKIIAALKATEEQLQLTSIELKVSRQNLVIAREEERRRLRRDLHDGLGPTLAAQVFRVGAARNLYQKQPEKAVAFLAEIETSLAGTIIDVKQLVNQLRPALIDQHGLIEAIRFYAKSLEVPFTIVLNLPRQSGPANAATEVAVWRIVQTSLDNVAKHADASTCWLTLQITDNHLELIIEDDGVGLATNMLAGVGISSMRERTAELQGSFSAENRHPTGTIINATFPFHPEATA